MSSPQPSDVRVGGRALVVTVVHHPQDSRIYQRQIPALLAAGWQVTYAAPFSAHGLPLTTPVEGLSLVDLPRAVGPRRWAAGWTSRRVMCRLAPRHDVVLVHDPELLLAASGLRLDHLVWDVHEDPAGALAVKEWVVPPLRGIGARFWRAVEGFAERRWTLLLAEHAYARRFRREHAVIPNAVVMPRRPTPAGGSRLVYVGNLTLARGTDLMVEVARRAHAGSGGEILLDVVGPARDEASRVALEAGVAEGVVRWHGFLPAAEAMAHVEGALAGLSLLRDLPNYRSSMPTKVIEYLAHGVPAITTPLPLADDLITHSGAGAVVPFEDVAAASDAALALWAAPEEAATRGARGRALVEHEYDWSVVGRAFVDALVEAAQVRTSRWGRPRLDPAETPSLVP